ncbi:MAG: 6-pyruvoyl tetrahydropterin synthase family protein [Candidatus Hodarchaeota archaeon]
MNQKDYLSTIAIERTSAHFSASHALISDHYKEGLHGHNYQVEIEIEGNVDATGVIIDFIFLENLLFKVLSHWDHYILLPLKNKNMRIRENEDNIEIEYGSRFYSIPKTEIKFLDCINVTTETLAQLLGEKMQDLLMQESFWSRIRTVKLTIWETPFYRASYTSQSNP